MQPISRKEAIEQGLTHYLTGKACKNGHVARRRASDRTCLECHRLRCEKCRPDRREYHRRYIKQWRLDNPEIAREHERRSQVKNRVKKNAYSREYGRRNRKWFTEYNRRWLKANPDKWRQYESRPKRKLENILRVRLRKALKRGTKTGSAVRDLGCSIQEFRKYIESQFSPNMSWDNHGTLWQLDHKRCLASFDLSDREQLLQACNFSNFQPLLKSDHRLKTLSDYQIIREQQKE